jgi:hypothetical protein
MSYVRIIALTALAMTAFAGNSLLCRVALKHTRIDAASFTTIRLLSGAVMLSLVVWMKSGRQGIGSNWLSALASLAILGGIAHVILKKQPTREV